MWKSLWRMCKTLHSEWMLGVTARLCKKLRNNIFPKNDPSTRERAGKDRQGRGEIPASRPHRGAAAPRRELSAAAGFTGSAAAAKGGPLLPLQKGDRIRHRTVGEGLVLSLRPMGNDALVEVAFDTAGTKKLMLRTAGAHITKLS